MCFTPVRPRAAYKLHVDFSMVSAERCLAGNTSKSLSAPRTSLKDEEMLKLYVEVAAGDIKAVWLKESGHKGTKFSSNTGGPWQVGAMVFKVSECRPEA